MRRCRSTLAFCTVLVGLHLLLTVGVGVRFSQQDPSQAQAQKTRDKSPSYQYESKDVILHHDVTTKRRLLQYGESKTTPAQPYEDWASIGCLAGHVKDFVPVCSTKKCLGILRYDRDMKKRTFTLPRKHAVPPKVRKEISYLSGNSDFKHVSVIGNMTDMQWLHGVYGSVGEFGVAIGQLASVLAYNNDDAAGEKLVFSDHFKNIYTDISPDEQYRDFLSNMDRWDVSFAEVKPAGKRRGYLYHLHPMELNKDVFLERKIPQFRLISLNGFDNPVTIAIGLQTAACILRDGGIVVVDASVPEATRAALKIFFKRFGSKSLTPLFDAGGKMYLCTANWKQTYMNYILHKYDIVTEFGISQTESTYEFVKSPYLKGSYL